MDTILLAITIVSLAAACFMGAAAWRLSRDERARSGARIAALAAAADAHDPSPSSRVSRPIDLSAPVIPEAPFASATPASSAARATAPWAPARVSPPLGDSFLGRSVAEPSKGGQRGLALAAVALFAILVVGYFTVFSSDSRAATAVAAATESPLELVSLRHERQSGELAIAGLVRNPVNGIPVEKLAAVVFLFDQQGAFVKSSRADIDFTRLAPGDESPFVITLEAPSSVARYRVSFRTDAGVVPHIDRRGQEPIARDTP
jgi:hypothetical protein